MNDKEYKIQNEAMLLRLKDAKSIWYQETIDNQYVVFKGSFIGEGKKTILDIVCDANYIFYFNGKLLSLSQSPSYPEHPIVDSISFTSLKGQNDFLILAYHLGSKGFSSYCSQKAFLRFAITENKKTLQISNENIQSALSSQYISGRKELLTPQLGYRVFLDFTKDERNLPFFESVLIDKSDSLFELRRNKKCVLDFKNFQTNKSIRVKKNTYRIDLKEEQVGYLSFSLNSPCSQKAVISYGEHLVNDELVYQIGNRNFSFEINLQKGRNDFFEGFLRVGARYLELNLEEDLLEEPFFGLVPVSYPFKEKKLYQIKKEYLPCFLAARKTLECCYHEHYEDCAWREQCLYALDSLNQIDAGLLLFKNTEQIRSSLRLFSQDIRKDGLLSICSPSRDGLTIPSFSLFYITAVLHYIEATNDISFLKETLPKLKNVLSSFTSRLSNGLTSTFEGEDKWNFYEWEPGLEGELGKPGKKKEDLVLNCLLILALEDFDKLLALAKEDENHENLIETLRFSIKETFLDSKDGLYFMSLDDPSKSVLGNSLVLLAEVPSKEEGEEIASKLFSYKNYGLTETSLSMKRFYYDALLKTDKEKYQEYVRKDAMRSMDVMLQDKDSTGTFWETLDGYKAFEGAGSLCHGWGTILVKYLFETPFDK